MDDPRRPPRAAGQWSDLGRRALSAAVLAPVALVCIWAGGAVYVGLILLAGIVLAAEWIGLCGVGVLGAGGAIVVLAVLLGAVAQASGAGAIGLVVLAAGFAATWQVTKSVVLAAGVLYVGIPMLSLLALRVGAATAGGAMPGPGNVLFLVSIVWASDIGAYGVGRLLRGPKLAPSLSPGKTWSGACGGLLCALLVGVVASGTAGAAAIAALLGVVCQAGDLLESGIKRHFGVKDSGRLIPGHGGLLDRVDGLLAAAPVAALVVLGSRGGLFWQ